MRRRLLVVALVLVSVAGLRAETYRISVKKIERNRYIDTRSKTVIETRLCLELAAIPTDAVVNWEGRVGNNWIYFPDSQTKCDVVALR